MSLHPQPIGPVPEETARIARAAFPKGNAYTQMRDILGTVYDDARFAHLFVNRGRPVAPESSTAWCTSASNSKRTRSARR